MFLSQIQRRSVTVSSICRGIGSGKLRISEEVTHALKNNLPVVALESTIISHGMPFPRNLEVARKVESVVRSNGAIPATIAIINGNPCVGLSDSDLTILADHKSQGLSVMKASRRDIAFAIATKRTAATTVASTMYLAHLAGINVFATGGIGGAHRGSEVTMDISADLVEFHNTPVTVVCAGIKSILDIPKTLEVLETQGIPVVGYGCTQFPAFFTNNSGVKSPLTLNTPKEIANMMMASRGLSLNNGMVVGVPNPNPADSFVIQKAIEDALRSAESNNIHGFEVTPFVLASVEKLTSGKSLDANIALVMNNAKVASEIAKEYCDLSMNAETLPTDRPSLSFVPTEISLAPKNNTTLQSETVSSAQSKLEEAPDVLVFGGAVIDSIGYPLKDVKLVMGAKNKGSMHTSFGGVGRNIAEKIRSESNQIVSVGLISAVGNDLRGKSLIDDCISKGINTDLIIVNSGSVSTASFTAIHDHDGELAVGISDMDIFELISDNHIANQAKKIINQTKLVVIDGNLSPSAFEMLCKICDDARVPVFFDPTSNQKCLLPLITNTIHQIDVIKPNASELITLLKKAMEMGLLDNSCETLRRSIKANVSRPLEELDLVDIGTMGMELLRLMDNNPTPSMKHMLFSQRGEGKECTSLFGKHVLVSMGSKGVLWCGSSDYFEQESNKNSNANVMMTKRYSYRHFPAESLGLLQITHSSGAGDSFCSGVIAAMMSSADCAGLSDHAIQAGLKSARDHLAKNAQGFR